MKTLSIVVVLVALAGAGAVGGYDYATNGDLGILPSSWTGSCGSCCSSEPCCLGCEETTAKVDEDACPHCASATATVKKAATGETEAKDATTTEATEK